LADRRGGILVEHVDALRAAVRATRAERPFRIDAWVVLPDHMHAVWTLPEGHTDYSVRWRLIKTRFTKSVGRIGAQRIEDRQGRSGNLATPVLGASYPG
jgi:putative transposase